MDSDSYTFGVLGTNIPASFRFNLTKFMFLVLKFGTLSSDTGSGVAPPKVGLIKLGSFF